MFNDVFTAVYQVCHLNNRMLLLTCKNVQSVLVQFLAFCEVVTTNLLIRKSITHIITKNQELSVLTCQQSLNIYIFLIKTVL